MDLEYIYKTGYYGETPNFVDKRAYGDFLFANMICGLVDELQQNEKDVTFLDIFSMLYCNMGLTLDDLAYGLKNRFLNGT